MASVVYFQATAHARQNSPLGQIATVALFGKGSSTRL